MNNRDPREVFPEVITPAEDYKIYNAIGNQFLLRSAEDELILTKNQITVMNNPLLAEAGLFDTVTIERRAARKQAEIEQLKLINKHNAFPLIVKIKKATREDILNFIPLAIILEDNSRKEITLEDLLDKEKSE